MPYRTITLAFRIAPTTSALTGANCVITASASATAAASSATTFVCASTTDPPAASMIDRSMSTLPNA